MGEAFVGSDNFSFVKQTVDYLCRTGVAAVFLRDAQPCQPQRQQAAPCLYPDSWEEAGLEPHVVKVEGEGWGFEEIGRQGAHDVIASGGLATDTVLCSNDRLAIGFLAACYERGLRVGRGEGCALRIASHDDHPFSPLHLSVAHHGGP